MTKQFKNYLLTFLLLLLLLSPLILHIANLIKIENSWQSANVSFKQISLDAARRTLEKLDVDTSLPGNGNLSLTFTAPFGLLFEDTAYNDCSFSRGDVLECDFVSWSHNFFRERMVKLFINGKGYSAKLSTTELTCLYYSALKQNGLGPQFQADSGNKLTFFSAKSAIKSLDKVLFEKGIHKAYDYPYDRRMVTLIAGLCVLFSIPIGILITASFSIFRDSIKYRAWLRQYNRQKIESWDKIAGTLPQFVSLKASSLDKPIMEYRRPKLRKRILEMFKPVKFNKTR